MHLIFKDHFACCMKKGGNLGGEIGAVSCYCCHSGKRSKLIQDLREIQRGAIGKILGED